MTGRVRPEAAAELSTPLTIEVEVKLASGRVLKKKVAGPASDIDRHAAEIAVFASEGLGLPVDPGAKRLLTDTSYPFAVERFLGLARTHLDADRLRKAIVMYDRASELMKQAPIPEALAGRTLAEALLAGRGEATFGARADLAPPAAERAEVALKHGDDVEARRALEAFLRYTEDRARRWSVELPLARGTAVVVARGSRWVVQAGDGPRSRLAIEPRTGAVLTQGPGIRGLIGTAGTQPLALEGKALLRLDEAGAVKWRVELPVRPHGVVGEAVDLTSGLAGIMGEREVVWVETSFGTLGQRATEVRPLASGTGGILVATSPDAPLDADGQREIALLRPGKKTPTWLTRTPEPVDAALTQDRVVLLTRDALLLLRTHDGKEAARPISLEPAPKGGEPSREPGGAGEGRAPGPAEGHIIGAEGRYATVALGDRVAIVDVLGGELTASVKGPGRPVAGYTAAAGVAIVYATGDLLFFDRSGALVDRALVPGEPFDLAAGSPMTPGPVAITTRGLFAFAEVSADEAHPRDVDAMLRLAALLDRQKAPQAALRLAEAVARASAGRIDRAELLRAELLGRRQDPASRAAAKRARARAEDAKDPTKPLGRFRLFD